MKKTFVQNTVIIWLFLYQGLSYAQELIPYRYGELWGYCTPDKNCIQMLLRLNYTTHLDNK